MMKNAVIVKEAVRVYEFVFLHKDIWQILYMLFLLLFLQPVVFSVSVFYCVFFVQCLCLQCLQVRIPALGPPLPCPHPASTLMTSSLVQLFKKEEGNQGGACGVFGVW